ncbi:Cytochrome b5 reductase 4 [Porphyridium purpureum]|uniref:Cytochrome b5 reductase 4 n=1 Tax=Porphyridium purpureum TaxID=35688 RepID=A0A5J4YKE0_PORPP|nr:Cytochrome b5 reductase 4 [Porphyridium purpureum]|eukprot:POR7114..scf297_16
MGDADPNATNAQAAIPAVPADQMKVSGGRQKVPLKPGFSQLDWIRKHAALPMPRIRTVKLEELRAHQSREFAWTAIRGLVYDISFYIDFHPGGDKLMLAAGKDGTSLFDKYHAWVNIDSLMQKCVVGYLVSDDHR